MTVLDPGSVRIVLPGEVPNGAWLHGGIPSAGQQAWGAALIDKHPFVAFPSVVSRFSWNIVFHPDRAKGKYAFLAQAALELDTRLNPPAP
jgi:RES domain-containing protein